MIRENMELRVNSFTQLGFESVDNVVTAALKRGSGRGESPHIDITLQSGAVEEVPRSDVESIRRVVDDSDSSSIEFSTLTVLSTIYNTVRRAKAI
jgi:hypothetical protein